MPTVTTPPVVPERSPPDVTAAVVAITDGARRELRALVAVIAVVAIAAVAVGIACMYRLNEIQHLLTTKGG